jgi:hypothetical protein
MALSCITAEDVLKTVKDKNVQMIRHRTHVHLGFSSVGSGPNSPRGY